MAFNLQLPGSDMLYSMSWFDKDFAARQKKAMVGGTMNYCTMYDYKQKAGYCTPNLCFQTDVMYPNALAAVSCHSCEQDRFVMGCTGNQIQTDFVLQPRVPVAVPLVQYPSNALDTCAQPVLNWERYMKNLKKEFEFKHSLLRGSKSMKEASKLKVEGLCKETPDNLSTEPQPSSTSRAVPYSIKSKSKRKKRTRGEIARNISRNPIDLEMNQLGKKIQQREEEKDLIAQGKTIKQTMEQLPIEIYKNKPTNDTNKKFLTSFRKFKTLPESRIEATWNYFYGGINGACCYVENTRNNSNSVFAASQSQLRKVALEKTEPSSMLSYRVKSVWEEDLPTGGLDVNDTIFQIVPTKKFDMIGVRRGKRIGIYNIEDEEPYLLESIPSIFYGTNEYNGWKQKGRLEVIKDPLLLGFDFNPQYVPEFITIDENMQIRICDISKGKTVNTYRLSKSLRSSPGFKDYPKFRKVNDATGISFSTYGQIFFAYGDSTVVLGDRRDSNHSRTNLIDIFDLRKSVSSISWSDQTYFNESKVELNDYISSVRTSGKQNYYYVGTTTRILLMDLRVPGQPVLKMHHGMDTAATYLDTYTDDSFEVVVAGNQRLPKTFCAVTDHAHVNCADRPSCEARNPVLSCLPRHLSSSMEFFDTAFAEGYGLTWETDQQRAKHHNYAWTTGLSICKGLKNTDPRKPPGIFVFTSNCFGDVFLQEWEQGPIEVCRKTELKDYKFTTFLEQWRDSMKSKSMIEFQKPSLNPMTSIDCSLVLEPCARNIQRMTKVRDKPFDPFTPNEIQHHYTLDTLTTFESRLKQLRKLSKTELDHSILDVWDTHDNNNFDETEVKQEEDEMQNMYASDGNYDSDVEFVYDTPEEQEELVELEEQFLDDDDKQQDDIHSHISSESEHHNENENLAQVMEEQVQESDGTTSSRASSIVPPSPEFDEVMEEEGIPLPPASASPDLWSQLYSQEYATEEVYEAGQELYENRQQSDDEDEEFGDFIPSSQPKTNYSGYLKKSGF